MMYKNIKRDLIERTVEILKDNDKNKNTMHEVTLLLNCMITILTIPNENRDKKVTQYKSGVDIIEKIKELKIDYNEELLVDNKQSIRYLRNAIAHVGIEQSAYHKNEIEKIILKNYNEKVVEITPLKLKELVYYIADQILKII